MNACRLNGFELVVRFELTTSVLQERHSIRLSYTSVSPNARLLLLAIQPLAHLISSSSAGVWVSFCRGLAFGHSAAANYSLCIASLPRLIRLSAWHQPRSLSPVRVNRISFMQHSHINSAREPQSVAGLNGEA